MKPFYFACLLLLICSDLVAAQSKTYRCEVSVADFNTDKGITLGNFNIQSEREKFFIKSFKFPDTNLFVTARYIYIDGDIQDAANRISRINLTLVLSKKAYKTNIEYEMNASDVVSNATTSVSAESFDGASVQTIYL